MNKNQAIDNYKGLVYDIASEINIPNSTSLEYEDICQIGFIGLLEALDSYDESHNNKFITFAYKLIKGRIIDTIRKLGGYSRQIAETAKDINNESERLRQLRKYEPPADDVCDNIKISLDKYYLVESIIKEQNYPLDYDGEYSHTGILWQEIIPDEKATSPQQKSLDESEIKLLLESVFKLERRKQDIVIYYYWLNKKLLDIADILGLSEGRVSQLKLQAIDQMSKYIINKRGNNG